MDMKIAQFRQKMREAKAESEEYIQTLVRKVNAVGDKMKQQIEDYEKTIENNIAFFSSVTDPKFQNYLYAQLEYQLSQDNRLLRIPEREEADHQGSAASQQVSSTENSKLVEVHWIMQKALNLFSEQHEKAIAKLTVKSFKDMKIDFSEDFIFSQDRAHANISMVSNVPLEKQSNKEEICILSDITELQINQFVPSYFGINVENEKSVKCFCVLDDNRRGILCTRSSLLLVDLFQGEVIRETELRGSVPTLPTCLQPLYSYYQDVTANSNSSVFKPSDSLAIHLDNKPYNNDEKNVNSLVVPEKNKTRQRRQLLVAVGMGNLSATIDICIFNIQTMQQILRLPGHTRMICKIIQAPLDYDAMLTFSSDRKIMAWSLTKADNLYSENTQHSQSLNDAIILNEKELCTFSLNGEVFIWDILYGGQQDQSQESNTFTGLRKKIVIHRSCLSLYIGQPLCRQELNFFSITSQGVLEQKYFLELNDFAAKILLKHELPHKVVGLNVIQSHTSAFALITYQDVNFCDIFKIPMNSISGQNQLKLEKRIPFQNISACVTSVIENPRVQFAKSADPSKLQVYIALDTSLVSFSIQIL